MENISFKVFYSIPIRLAMEENLKLNQSSLQQFRIFSDLGWIEGLVAILIFVTLNSLPILLSWILKNKYS